MVNEVILVGRITGDIRQDPHHPLSYLISLEVVRHFRNSDGLYEADIIDVSVWSGKAKSIEKISLHPGFLAVKGRLEPCGSKLAVVAEKATLLDPYLNA